MFYYKNITVVTNGDKIIGLANVIEGGKRYSFQVPELSRSEVVQKYFNPLIDEIENLDGYYLCNFCIDEEYRNKGIGHYLLKEIAKEYQGTLYTDAIADNVVAVKVYRDNRFVVTEEYIGYSGVHPEGLKCVKLKRTFF